MQGVPQRVKWGVYGSSGRAATGMLDANHRRRRDNHPTRWQWQRRFVGTIVCSPITILQLG
jgi:hypothetical protein